MNNLTQQVKQGAEQALASLSQGWRELKHRASGALTHFRASPEGNDELSAKRLSTLAGWGFMAADVVDGKDEVVVRLEAPGLRRKDFTVELRESLLCIAGEKRTEHEAEGDSHHVYQCAYGKFRREIPLPVAVDADRAKASYRDGVLRIALPKTKGAQPDRFTVQVK